MHNNCRLTLMPSHPRRTTRAWLTPRTSSTTRGNSGKRVVIALGEFILPWATPSAPFRKQQRHPASKMQGPSREPPTGPREACPPRANVVG